MTPYTTPADPIKHKYNILLRYALRCINVIIKLNFQKCKLSFNIFQSRRRILREEWKSKYDPKKMGKFTNVCALLHNTCVYYKVQNSEIHYITSAAPTSYFDEGVGVPLETSHLNR